MNNSLAPSLTPLSRFQEEAEHLPVNLRDLLHDLGNRLVLEHGFAPANLHGCSNHINRTTEPLVRFLVWLQQTPEAGSVLSDMGVWQENTSANGRGSATERPRAVGSRLPSQGKKKSSVA
jgi:hypothetical protein